MEEHNILKLDYDAVLSELEAFESNTNHGSDEAVWTTITNLEADWGKFKALYEATSNNERTSVHKIAKAVTIADSKKQGGFEPRKGTYNGSDSGC
jgi:hypothetical protein